MQIIIMGRNFGQTRTLALGWGALLGLVAFLVPVLSLAAWAGAYWSSLAVVPVGAPMAPSAVVERVGQDQLNALALRVGDLQARLMRLDALGQRLVQVADLREGEFDFSQQPAQGGSEAGSEVKPYGLADVDNILALLDDTLSRRELQLGLLDNLLAERELADETFVAGLPVNDGYLSSPFGFRSDPFSGARSWHGGVDYAGPAGSDIVSVAAGVVLQADSVNGYGEMIAIDHGGGLISRYAHCKQVYVRPGERVQKGQVIATMGRSGRSTGTHVHFEILKHGQPQNPEHYIHRASR